MATGDAGGTDVGDDGASDAADVGADAGGRVDCAVRVWLIPKMDKEAINRQTKPDFGINGWL